MRFNQRFYLFTSGTQRTLRSARRGVTARLALQLACLSLLAAIVCNEATAEKPDDICAIAQSAISEASEIRGLALKKPVPCEAHTKEQVKKYLLDTIETQIPPEKLLNEERVYKLLGLIPEEYAYKEGLVQLYVGQIGGYYDPQKDYFVMASWMPAVLQTTIAVHELTHALQDQHFDLETFLDHDLDNTDLLLARSALTEGDASLVMTDYTRRLFGQPTLQEETGVESLMLQNVIGASFMTALGTVPESLQLMLIFPYTSGLRFGHYLLKQDGYRALDRAFQTPPRTTEEILHPEKYPAIIGKEYSVVTLSDIPAYDQAQWEVAYRDTMGEFGISLFAAALKLEKQVSAQTAAGWGGDLLTLSLSRKNNCDAERLDWVTRWDSTKDAEEFFTGVRTGLKTRFGIDPATFESSPAHIVGKTWRLHVTQEKSRKEVLLTMKTVNDCVKEDKQ
ncbi:MAG: hypothetical protein KDD64_00190 [Bdellovibrionales bacterium]|nr:hypothetical protein [Bdellovibrionales bacterium]